MWTKGLLLAAPTLVSLFLLQSYFWVPSFEDQARGDPGRLTRYISASIGDASILNPTLAADTASSEINALVFEGLIDRNLDLSFRGRLAESWRISEEAYLYADESVRLRDGPAGPSALLARLQAARAAGAPVLRKVQAMEVLPAETETVRLTPPPSGPPPRGAPPPAPIPVTIRRPPRIKFTLTEVDQDFFPELDRLLGGYATTLDPLRYVTAPTPELARLAAEEHVQPTEANPVIVFTLRPGVRFHDGRELTARDVKFTYETIVDPRNLSPRVPDFEPVKRVDTPDARTVRVTYKRLFQPGFESWAMGILPEHLLNRERLDAEARAAGRDPAKFTVRDAAFNRRPVGSGPFRFAEWRTDQYIRLARNDDYWEGPPNFREYFVRIIPDLLTTELAFYAGTADAYVAQPQQVARLQNDPRFHTAARLALGYTYIGYNMRRPVFQDVRVRAALGHGDRRRRDHPLRPLRAGRAHVGPVPPPDALLRSGPGAPAVRPGRRRPAPRGGGLAAERRGRPGEGRAAPRLHAHHELGQRGAESDHGDRPERLAAPRGPGRHARARVGRLHQPARRQGRLRRGRARLGHGPERRHLPALPLEPDRALPAQLRRLSEPEGRRPDDPHPPGVRRGTPDGDGPGAPSPDRGRPALHVPVRPPRPLAARRQDRPHGAGPGRPAALPALRAEPAGPDQRSTSTSG